MKKIIALFLAAAVFVLAGCSDTNKDYSVLLPFVNGSTNDKIEVTLAFVNNDSRMITGNPGASTAEGYDSSSGKYIKVKIADKNETPLCEDKIDIQVQENGKISLYIDKVNFNNLKAATVTVTGYTKAEDGTTHQEFTKGTLKDVDLTLGKTIYVPMEYIITEGETGPSGNITFSVGYNSQADWEKNGFDVSNVGDTPRFEVSYAPLNGGTEKILSKIETEPLTENGYYVGNPSGILDHLKFRIEDKSGYYKLKVTWKNCPVIVNGFKITQDVEMIIANDNIFCIPDYGSVTINDYYEPKFYMPVKKLWAVNGTAEGDGESMATPASLSSLLTTIASDDKYKLYSINCSNIATKIYYNGGSYLYDACKYDATSINNITCNAEKYINIKSTDFNASMMIQSKDGKMIAVANESIAVTKSGDEEAFLPAELKPKSETDYDGATTESFDFILEKGAKVDILNTDFHPNGINVYADNNYHIYQETDNYTTYDQWSSCCFARQEIGNDATTTDALDNNKCKIYIYNSTDKTYVRSSDVAIGTINQYTTADNSKQYKLFYLKQSL
ncbi:MAG: hypothetical protein MR494_09220 [Spirochaetia bacterium]|nr:hypothetical protein [Spirochaetia bacterium]